MTRYEKGDRNSKDEMLTETASILNASINSMKKYDYNKPIKLQTIPNTSVPTINTTGLTCFFFSR